MKRGKGIGNITKETLVGGIGKELASSFNPRTFVEASTIIKQ